MYKNIRESLQNAQEDINATLQLQNKLKDISEFNKNLYTHNKTRTLNTIVLFNKTYFGTLRVLSVNNIYFVVIESTILLYNNYMDAITMPTFNSLKEKTEYICDLNDFQLDNDDIFKTSVKLSSNYCLQVTPSYEDKDIAYIDMIYGNNVCKNPDIYKLCKNLDYIFSALYQLLNYIKYDNIITLIDASEIYPEGSKSSSLHLFRILHDNESIYTKYGFKYDDKTDIIKSLNKLKKDSSDEYKLLKNFSSLNKEYIETLNNISLYNKSLVTLYNYCYGSPMTCKNYRDVIPTLCTDKENTSNILKKYFLQKKY